MSRFRALSPAGNSAEGSMAAIAAITEVVQELTGQRANGTRRAYLAAEAEEQLRAVKTRLVNVEARLALIEARLAAASIP